MKVQDDGLVSPEVREWSLTKYKLVGYYCDIFTNGMRYKWDQLVYIDLFAGAGYVKIKESGNIYKASPLIALSIPYPFTKYIFCDIDLKNCEALKFRVERDFPDKHVSILNVDSNLSIDSIINEIPSFKKGNTLLPFCFVDPYSLNLHFKTISELGEKRLMDFLILQALYMDGNRNLKAYLNEENDKISYYLGDENWRDLYVSDQKSYKTNFVKFLADQYDVKMEELEYIVSQKKHRINSNLKNLPLYYLSFYSKNKRGIDYYEKIEKLVSNQYSLEFD